MKLLIAMLSLSLLPTACQIVTTSPNVTQADAVKHYRLDLPIEVNCGKGQTGCQKGSGLMILEPAETYEFRGVAPDDAKILTIEDCTGETIFYGADRKFGITYTMPERVRSGLCYVAIAAYAPRYRQAMALLDVRNVKNPLHPSILCNQAERDRKGVGLCQSKVGKLTVVEFDEPVNVYTEPGCEEPSGGPRLFEMTPKKAGKCWFKFLAKDDRTKEFRLTIYSYDEYFMEGR